MTEIAQQFNDCNALDLNVAQVRGVLIGGLINWRQIN